MVISDKEAYRILGLPLGVDRDAICEKYKQLSAKLSASKSSEDRKKLDQVVAAFGQLISQAQRQSASQNQPLNSKNKTSKSYRNHISNIPQDNNTFDSSSDDDVIKGKNGNIKNNCLNKNDTDINKEKRKAEKRKAKKKKQKEKKKQEKLENNSIDSKRLEESNSESEEEILEEVQGIDHNSAFVAMVGKKLGSNGVHSTISNSGSNSIRSAEAKKIKNKDKSNVLKQEALQIQSRQFAMRGNDEANKGEYERAVRLFSEAIRLDPNDHRFFGNRSYCYDQLHEYEKALKDADKAIELSPEWPKGHFRRGRALKGLGQLLEGEAAFEQVLKFDPVCDDAITEINKVRKRRLVEMGFTELQAKAAIKKYSQVQPALDALLAGEFLNSLEHIFFSDDEEEIEEEEVAWQPPPKQKDQKMNPRNVDGLTSLWVGNVVPDVTEKALTKLFSKYGNVTSVRQLKEKYCAFVNYSDKKSAGNAMENLQSHELCGSRLLIKFPDNPIVNGAQNIIIRKTKNQNGIKATPPNSSQSEPSNSSSASALAADAAAKVKGPVNGDECYFWRTTGCGFAETCKYNHVPKHKGIDKKPWQK